MRRESVYVCTYSTAEEEHVAHVRAWDAREAAELFACEMAIECVDCGGCAVAIDEIRVRPVAAGVASALAA